MCVWNEPVFAELEIAETAHNWTGIYRDGGYIGDGEITGHLSWDKVDPTSQTSNPSNPVDKSSIENGLS